MSTCWIIHTALVLKKGKGKQRGNMNLPLFHTLKNHSCASVCSPPLCWCSSVSLLLQRNASKIQFHHSPTTTNQTFLPQLWAVYSEILLYWLYSTRIHKNELDLQGQRIANPWPSEKDKLRKSAQSSPRRCEGFRGLSCSLVVFCARGFG